MRVPLFKSAQLRSLSLRFKKKEKNSSQKIFTKSVLDALRFNGIEKPWGITRHWVTVTFLAGDVVNVSDRVLVNYIDFNLIYKKPQRIYGIREKRTTFERRGVSLKMRITEMLIVVLSKFSCNMGYPGVRITSRLQIVLTFLHRWLLPLNPFFDFHRVVVHGTTLKSGYVKSFALEIKLNCFQRKYIVCVYIYCTYIWRFESPAV